MEEKIKELQEEIHRLRKQLQDKEDNIDILYKENRILLRLLIITERINDIQDTLTWARRLVNDNQLDMWILEAYQHVRELSNDLTKLRKEINTLWDEVI